MTREFIPTVECNGRIPLQSSASEPADKVPDVSSETVADSCFAENLTRQDLEKRQPGETLRVLTQRASCRDFLDRPIPNDLLKQVLQAGVHAPSAGNLQPFSVIKIENANTRRELMHLCGEQTFIARAPVSLLFCIDWARLRRWAELEKAPFTAEQSWRMFWLSFEDTVISAQNMVTAADALGLGSVYVGMVYEAIEPMREMFRMPECVYPTIMLCLGYPDQSEPSAPSPKLPLEMIVHDEVYQPADDRTLCEAHDTKHAKYRRPITEEDLAEIERVATNVHGPEFAAASVEHVRREGSISPIHTYFCLRYQADRIAAGNEALVDQMRRAGFNWVKDFVPHVDGAADDDS